MEIKVNTNLAKHQRDRTIDILRGIAIFTMLCANVIGYVTPAKEHPMWIRFFGSFAAPLFILLAGYVASMGLQLKNYKFSYFLKRGLMVILTAVLIDVLIWKIYPFTTYDVLYVIGLSIILICFFNRIGLYAKGFIIILLFGLPPVLQYFFGYTDYPTEYYLNGELTTTVTNQTNILQHFFIDGWFPVFPWLGFAFLGGLLYHLKEKYDNFKSNKLLFLGLVSVITGALGLYYYPFSQLLSERGAYNEIFYPPTTAYILSAIGITILLFAIISRMQKNFIFKPLIIMGETSMFIYVLHTAFIQFIVVPCYTNPENEIPAGSFNEALIVYGLLTLACFIPSLIIHFIKRKWKIKNFLFRFYFGS
ncbi:MAG: heparan-alpha-glucosaminide N-acetyltransferase domain-containing protein [Bacteroidota bacterium]